MESEIKTETAVSLPSCSNPGPSSTPNKELRKEEDDPQILRMLELQERTRTWLRGIVVPMLADASKDLPEAEQKMVSKAGINVIRWASNALLTNMSYEQLVRYIDTVTSPEFMKVQQTVDQVMGDQMSTFFRTELIRLRVGIGDTPPTTSEDRCKNLKL